MLYIEMDPDLRERASAFEAGEISIWDITEVIRTLDPIGVFGGWDTQRKRANAPDPYKLLLDPPVKEGGSLVFPTLILDGENSRVQYQFGEGVNIELDGVNSLRSDGSRIVIRGSNEGFDYEMSLDSKASLSYKQNPKGSSPII